MEPVFNALADFRKSMEANLAQAEAKLIEIQTSKIFGQAYKDESRSLYKGAIANHKTELVNFDLLYGEFL